MFEEPAAIHGLLSKNVKRCVVKRRHIEVDDGSVKALVEGIRAVFQGRPISIERLYQTCERAVGTGRKGEEIYGRFRAELEREAREMTRKLAVKQDKWLDLFLATWTKWDHDAHLIRSFLLYLDRSWVVSTRSRPCLALALNLFREIVQSPTIERYLHHDLIDLIMLDRAHGNHSVKTWVDILIQIDLYKPFEEVYISRTKEWCQQFQVTPESVADHLSHVQDIRQKERDRCLAQFSGRTVDLVDALILSTTIEQRSDILVLGFKALASAKHPAVAEMYHLIQNRKTLLDQFSAFCLEQGRLLIMDASQDAKMVENLLGLKKRLDEMVTSFDNDDNFANAEREAFQKFLNERQNKPAEMIAKWIDGKLRSRTQEAELESALGDVLFLFRYIQGKDTFEAFYKRDLAKRLLLNRSSSSDAERSMLNKLRNECGAAFTAKLEGMFKDVAISDELMQNFNESKGAQDLPLGLSVNVLTMGHWPSYPQSPATIPGEMARSLEIFRSFYTNKHAGRTLQFQNALAHCIVTARLGERRYELEISLFQALVLLLFNEHDRLTLIEIQEATGIEVEELKRTLLSVSVGKERLLRKKPHSPTVENDHIFTLNQNYESQRIRVRINQIQAKETVQENVATHEQVFSDRQFTVDAAIVRIMKAKKKVKHQLLIAELFEQLKFPMQMSDIKKRISSLVDRDYMERDSEDQQMYIYLA